MARRNIEYGLLMWGCSSVGRALAWHARGRQFESDQLHHEFSLLRATRTIKKIQCLAVALAKADKKKHQDHCTKKQLWRA